MDSLAADTQSVFTSTATCQKDASGRCGLAN